MAFINYIYVSIKLNIKPKYNYLLTKCVQLLANAR